MAASGLPKAGSGRIPPLSKAPSRSQSFQRTPSHRVYFSEVPSKHQNRFSEMPPKHETRWESTEDEKERRGCRLCCAWTSLIAGSLILVLLLVGSLFLSSLQGALPDFRIKRLSITNLDVVTKDQMTLLSAEVHLLINATNKNDRYELSYGSLKVDVSSDNVPLGNAEVSPFNQDPQKSSELEIQTRVKKSAVDGEDAKGLKSDLKEKQVVIDVIFKGSISFNFEGRKLSGLPLTVLCQNIEQNVIDNGLQPKCRVKMLSFL